VQSPDLLRQRHFIQPDIDLRFVLSALRQQGSEARRCDAIGQRDAQLSLIAGRRCPHAAARLIQSRKDTRHMLKEKFPRAGQSRAAGRPVEQTNPEFFF
jgi:hypothetical protein